MQKQLLIIGNGFDLACKLKSRYIDFYKECIEDNIGQAFGLKQTKRGETFNFWENLLHVYSVVNKNIEDYNWCDIEGIILKTLWQINFGDSRFDFPDSSKGLYARVLYCFESNNDPTDFVRNEKDAIKKYLFNYCVQFFYNNYAITNNVSNNEKRKTLNKHLLSELKNLEKRFCGYLRASFFPEYAINTISLLGKLTGFSETIFQNIQQIKQHSKRLLGIFKEWENIHILSFNYTIPLESFSENIPCQYSNVHGKMCHSQCDNSCSYSNVIFGIDDKVLESNKTENDLRLFSKTYRTLFMMVVAESILPLKTEKIIIKFFGHSLSTADYSYFQSIFDYYSIYDNSKVSLEFYYLPIKPESKNKNTDAVYGLINQYGLTLNNKDQGKNLMHKLILEKRIKIIEMKDFVALEKSS